VICGINTTYQQQKGQIPITLLHDEKCNKIGMVVVGFDLEKYDESGRSCWGYCRLGCGLELCGIGSFVSVMVFVG
jgi:hypothetical protein